MMQYLFAICYLFYFNICFASDINTYLENINSYQAHFTQTISNGTKIIQATSGSLKFLKPAYFIWQTKIPDQKILADGKKIYIYDKDLDQVTIKPQSKELNNTPAMFLISKPAQLNKHFNITNCKTEPNCFILTAINKESSYQRITIRFNTNHQLNSLDILDALKQSTFIRFNNIKVNARLTAKDFTFVIPKNVDLIE